MTKLLLALLSGTLLAFSWPEIGWFPLVFIAFVPLFFLEKQCRSGKEVFMYSFVAFFIFNLITTYWVWHATPSGAIVAFSINSILMSIPLLFFHKIRLRLVNRLAYFSFILLWLAMEYLHLNWDLSWPWLTIGNVFACCPSLVQWYEFTGFLGGTFWVVLVNVLFFKLFFQYENKKLILVLAFTLFVPILGSYYMYYNFEEKSTSSIDVVIAQPNIDPYIEKFSKGYIEQLDDFISLVRPNITQETQLLLGPETALLEGIWENNFESSYSIKVFRKLQEQFPDLNIIVGVVTYKMFTDNEKKTNTVREIKNQNIFYDVYNSAVFVPDTGKVMVYHKTKLVPGAENMPFPYLLDPIARLIVDLGGTSGSLGSENVLNTFLVEKFKVSPLICYESVYGDMGVDNTNLLAIITNDGWWKNTAGYKQHFLYSRLRAIEQRKSIIRSANTGISCIINPRGDILAQSSWDEAICLNAKVSINNEITFYSQFGDYIGRLSVFLSVVFIIISFVRNTVDNRLRV